MIARVLAPGLAAAALAGCSGADPASGSSKPEALSTNGIGSAATTAWNDYLADATATPLQAGCTPYLLPNDPTTEYRGTAVLLHGYSACPQQFAQIAQNLSASGYTVLVPLLPGHGHVPITSPSGSFRDDLSAMPTEADYQAYGELAGRMAAIAAQAPTTGENVVMGLSVGGALAASAAEQSPGTFKRVLLMNAFFDVSIGLLGDLIPIVNAILPNVGFTATNCAQSRNLGRAGYCDSTVTTVRAVQHFGQDTLAKIATITDSVQIAGLEDDPVASDSDEVTAATKIAGAQACFYEKGIPHSPFSPQDSPGVNMYWLTDLLDETQGYLVYADTFATAEASSIQPYNRCNAH